MYQLKKIFFSFTLLFLVAIISPPPSFAIPGQLIYDTNIPDVTNQLAPPTSCDVAIVAYKNESERNNSLYKACQVQKSQLEKTNLALIKELSQEKKKVKNIIIIVITIITSILSSLGIVFLRKKPSMP